MPDPHDRPTPQLLAGHAMRVVAGGALVALAAVLAHVTGLLDQRWQYAAMSVALVPQVIVDLLAVRDRERRARLRALTTPAPVLALVAAVLGVTGLVALLGGRPGSGLVALVAATGLGVAAAPASIRLLPRS